MDDQKPFHEALGLGQCKASGVHSAFRLSLQPPQSLCGLILCTSCAKPMASCSPGFQHEEMGRLCDCSAYCLWSTTASRCLLFASFTALTHVDGTGEAAGPAQANLSAAGSSAGSTAFSRHPPRVFSGRTGSNTWLTLANMERWRPGNFGGFRFWPLCLASIMFSVFRCWAPSIPAWQVGLARRLASLEYPRLKSSAMGFVLKRLGGFTCIVAARQATSFTPHMC